MRMCEECSAIDSYDETDHCIYCGAKRCTGEQKTTVIVIDGDADKDTNELFNNPANQKWCAEKSLIYLTSKHLDSLLTKKGKRKLNILQGKYKNGDD